LHLRLFRKQVDKAGLEGFIVHSERNIYYLTGFMSSGGAYLLVSEDSSPILWVSKLDWEKAKEEVRICDLRVIERRTRIQKTLSDELHDLGMRTTGFDEISVAEYFELGKNWGGDLKPEAQLIWMLRRVKDKEETERMRRAARIADIGVQVAIETIAPGTREYMVAAEAEYAMRTRQSEGTAFETIVASGSRSAFPHGSPTARKIQSGDLVIVDIGATFKHYRSDITRTIVVGKPSETQKRIYDAVTDAQETALRRYRDRERCAMIDGVARSLIRKRGYGKQFVHGLGHGIGLDIHEPPTVSLGSKDFLETGNIVSDEPGIYLPGVGGVRIEDMILVAGSKGERITLAPRSLEA